MKTLALALALTLTCAVSAAPVANTAVLPHLGANLPPITDYSFTPVYANLLHQARKFGSATAPWDEAAALGPDGWPSGDFGVVLMIGASKTTGNAGIYHLSFDGKAQVAAAASSAKVQNLTYGTRCHCSRAEIVMPSGEDQLMLSFTATGPGIKNVKLLRPGYDVNHPSLFTQPFLAHIARFKTLRFMDWLRTNNNAVTSWATRAAPATTHYASKAGVPWEHIVALANQTGQDIWINVPVAADDDYMLQLAKLFKASLNARSKIYVEYSNEVWNGGFAQNKTNRLLAIEELQRNPASPLAYDGKQKPDLIAYRRVAQRLKQISDIFRSVYGDAAMMNTIRPVLSSQVVQPITAQIGLDFLAAVYGPPRHYFYAIAGAPYFNLGKQQATEGLTPDQVLDAMRDSVRDLPKVNALEANRALASWYGLKFLAYEGGADTFGPGSLAAKKAANLDPRMRELCVDYLTRWYQQGGEMLMWFTAGAGNWDTRYGSWELTTDLSLASAPKIQCMDQMRALSMPTPQGRNPVPGTINALAFVGNPAPYAVASASRLRHLHPGMSLDYLIQAPKTGTYTLVIRAEAASPGQRIEVAVNGSVVMPAFELQSTGWGSPADNRPITLALEQGFNTLRLTTRSESLGFALSALTIR